jgi:hypothetical protein
VSYVEIYNENVYGVCPIPTISQQDDHSYPTIVLALIGILTIDSGVFFPCLSFHASHLDLLGQAATKNLEKKVALKVTEACDGPERFFEV